MESVYPSIKLAIISQLPRSPCFLLGKQYTPTRKFCCFAWDVLSCELRIAQRCDPKYAADLSVLTEQSYSSFCEYHSRRSASCALRWWSVALIVLALVVIIAIVLFVVYRKRQSKFTYDYETVTGPRK